MLPVATIARMHKHGSGSFFGERLRRGIQMVESFPYLIAIDGGGSRCRFAIATPAGRLNAEFGTANVFTDRAAAIRTLNTGLDALMDKARLPRAALADIPVYAGLAGVIDEEAAHEVAQRLPPRIIQIEDDRRSAVVGALGPKNGCMIGIGTGSFLARQAEDGIRFIGGYGPLIGDEASGKWLGAQLLRRVLLTEDGILPPTPLTQEISSRFGNDPMQIVAFSGVSGPAEFAEFAPRITAAAEKGDRIALELMRDGADYISKGLQALGFAEGEPICAVGGVAPHYAGYLPLKMQQALSEPEGTAIDGALQLAQELAERERQIHMSSESHACPDDGTLNTPAPSTLAKPLTSSQT